jgi:hypothetical protein
VQNRIARQLVHRQDELVAPGLVETRRSAGVSDPQPQDRQVSGGEAHP